MVQREQSSMRSLIEDLANTAAANKVAEEIKAEQSETGANLNLWLINQLEKVLQLNPGEYKLRSWSGDYAFFAGISLGDDNSPTTIQDIRLHFLKLAEGEAEYYKNPYKAKNRVAQVFLDEATEEVIIGWPWATA